MTKVKKIKESNVPAEINDVIVKKKASKAKAKAKRGITEGGMVKIPQEQPTQASNPSGSAGKPVHTIKVRSLALPQSPSSTMTNTDHIAPGGLPRTRRNVCIVGFAASTMTMAQTYFNDPDWEIWPLNQLYVAWPDIVPQATRWFQLHERKDYDNAVRDHKHSNWLASQTSFPIYMQEKDPRIPLSCKYPIGTILNTFPDYFTNSISWMIALAIYERFEKIAIMGVDMAQAGEYSEQRPSVEWLIGMAQGLGIEVYIPAKSDLMKAMWLYPIENDQVFVEKIDGRISELRGRCHQLATQEQQLRDQRMQLLGAVENMQYISQNWRNQVKENQVPDRGRLRLPDNFG